MLARRQLLAGTFGALVPTLASKPCRTYRVGDWVRVIRLPGRIASLLNSPHWERHATVFRRSLGGVYCVEGIENGDLALDVTRTAAPILGTIHGVIYLEPECVVRAAPPC